MLTFELRSCEVDDPTPMLSCRRAPVVFDGGGFFWGGGGGRVGVAATAPTRRLLFLSSLAACLPLHDRPHRGNWLVESPLSTSRCSPLTWAMVLTSSAIVAGDEIGVMDDCKSNARTRCCFNAILSFKFLQLLIASF